MFQMFAKTFCILRYCYKALFTKLIYTGFIIRLWYYFERRLRISKRVFVWAACFE